MCSRARAQLPAQQLRATVSQAARLQEGAAISFQNVSCLTQTKQRWAPGSFLFCRWNKWAVSLAPAQGRQDLVLWHKGPSQSKALQKPKHSCSPPRWGAPEAVSLQGPHTCSLCTVKTGCYPAISRDLRLDPARGGTAHLCSWGCTGAQDCGGHLAIWPGADRPWLKKQAHPWRGNKAEAGRNTLSDMKPFLSARQRCVRWGDIFLKEGRKGTSCLASHRKWLLKGNLERRMAHLMPWGHHENGGLP